MAWLGFISARACRHWQDASPFLPAFSFYERHQSAPIDAAPQAIIHAVQALDMQEDPLIRRLLALRQLPDRLRRRTTPARPFGFDSFTPLHQDSHELSSVWPAVSGGQRWFCPGRRTPGSFFSLPTPTPPNWCCALRSSQIKSAKRGYAPKPLSTALRRR